jgi:hypothetical protein
VHRLKRSLFRDPNLLSKVLLLTREITGLFDSNLILLFLPMQYTSGERKRKRSGGKATKIANGESRESYYFEHEWAEMQAAAKALTQQVPTLAAHIEDFVDAEDPDAGIEVALCDKLSGYFLALIFSYFVSFIRTNTTQSMIRSTVGVLGALWLTLN